MKQWSVRDVWRGQLARLSSDYTPVLCLLLAALLPVTTTDPCVCLKKHIGPLRRPLFLTHTVDIGDIDRFFVLENAGKVLEFSPNGEASSVAPYLDITAKVSPPGPSEIALGLLGLALHPNFKYNWKIYLFYTSKSSGQLYGVVSEFTAKAKYQSDPDSERVLMKIALTTGKEVGGHLFFGFDGYLYISVGDGGVENEGFAQNNLSLLGKILRINVEIASGGKNYSIPSGNPLVESGGQGRKEIYAKGARNMWRCSVDAGDVNTGEGRGRIFCGDVGEELYEEINIIEKGRNYGWNLKEGRECREGKACQDLQMETSPISVYEHTVNRAAVIGGYVYRGKEMHDLQGQYIFGDASSGEFFRLVEPDRQQGTWISHLLTVCGKPRCPCDAREDAPQHITSFSADKNEELYVLTVSSLVSMTAKGDVFKLVPPVSKTHDVTTCGGGVITDSSRVVFLWFCVFMSLLLHGGCQN